MLYLLVDNRNAGDDGRVGKRIAPSPVFQEFLRIFRPDDRQEVGRQGAEPHPAVAGLGRGQTTCDLGRAMTPLAKHSVRLQGCATSSASSVRDGYALVKHGLHGGRSATTVSLTHSPRRRSGRQGATSLAYSVLFIGTVIRLNKKIRRLRARNIAARTLLAPACAPVPPCGTPFIRPWCRTQTPEQFQRLCPTARSSL